jgi:predicted enzyme related to lactoylglutathione lyase
MSERERYPAGVPCWVDTIQPDPDAAVRFYAELFGWQFTGPGRMPGEPPGKYFVAQAGGRDVAGVASQPSAGAPPSAVWNTHISVESADDAAEKARDAGGAVAVAPFDAPPAGRMAVLRDPAGAYFCVWEPIERHGAQLVNEPGAWAMSLLATPDLSASAAFYGAVFGWETEPLDVSSRGIDLCRLPGFVGGEPHQPVPRDVVAAMMEVGGAGGDDVPPQWSVDFWVHDADATAAKADELGGNVVAAPHDTPGFRRAVLTDPQGATFSVSKLVAGA